MNKEENDSKEPEFNNDAVKEEEEEKEEHVVESEGIQDPFRIDEEALKKEEVDLSVDQLAVSLL